MSSTTTPAVTPRRDGEPEVDLTGYRLVHRAMLADTRAVADLADRVAGGSVVLTAARATALREYVGELCHEIHTHHDSEDRIIWPVIAASAGAAVDLGRADRRPRRDRPDPGPRAHRRHRHRDRPGRPRRRLPAGQRDDRDVRPARRAHRRGGARGLPGHHEVRVGRRLRPRGGGAAARRRVHPPALGGRVARAPRHPGRDLDPAPQGRLPVPGAARGQPAGFPPHPEGRPRRLPLSARRSVPRPGGVSPSSDACSATGTLRNPSDVWQNGVGGRSEAAAAAR